MRDDPSHRWLLWWQFSCSYMMLAQTGSTAGSMGAAKQRKLVLAVPQAAAKSTGAMAKTAWGEPDISGEWEPKMPPTAREYSGYSFASHKDVVPLMTPWGKEQYQKNKPSWGPLAVVDSTDPVNPTTGKEIGCFPTGVPRIWVHPFPTKIVQTPGVVYFLYEFAHHVREIYTKRTAPASQRSGPLVDGEFSRLVGGQHAGDRQRRLQ